MILAASALIEKKKTHTSSAATVTAAAATGAPPLLPPLGDGLPKGHKMPSNLYECKSLLNGLKMPYVKIDACVNNCMIYYKQDEHKDKCDFCNENRYVVTEPASQGHKRRPIPHKVLRYLPILPRLQRMFM
jgi:hypothetical protein